ncbi:Sensor_kinase_SpoOB-type, alpha-helical domain [Paenibacillus sp. UNCCL117]|uniref:sensor histidine kinase n=1 Tax=unclassified Paenibacillus TaxID=185978 RepID=UPI000890B6FE|nr:MULTISPECIES: ATP-binding protein [unclassified Paenibacillus]SDC05570.1 Sensor_kinase_SpoOB-type, alpha-helical domain [Paenibacillus sp. cl123]SFW37614.1 Sensor_kinase_SpoOB-type, alpha-helical domain [Paenibacillus sp. UNCCL117]
MQWLKKLPIKTTLLFLIILIGLNLVYYQHAKETIIKSEQEKLRLIFHSIIATIEQTAAGEKYVEDMMGQHLRTAAIAIRNRLDPDIAHVTNEELVRLSRELGIDHITLFVKTEDDIIGARSSDPLELGVSSRSWYYYYEAFQQLLEGRDVNVGIGQSLPNYWSGPIENKSSIPQKVNKWGYYYDGTTNYIINPFMHATHFREYQETTGISDAIAKLAREYEGLGLEIAVLNTDNLMERQPHDKLATDSIWLSKHAVILGNYDEWDEREKQYAQAALDKNEPTFFFSEKQGGTQLRSFTPIHTDYLKFKAGGQPPLVAISSDYSQVEAELSRQLKLSLLFMLISSLLSVMVMAFIVMIYNRNKERALQEAQEAHTDSVEKLFQSIREQRHDFSNHIQTIHSFLSLKHYEELQNYTSALVGEIRVVHDLVNIENPALIALIQAKLTQAECQSIQLEYAFSGMGRLNDATVQATDVVKVVSNLIDNAFDASMELEPEDRYVMVEGSVSEDLLELKVCNWGNPIPPEVRRKLFDSGFSLKSRKRNSGLGLHIVKRIVDRHKGDIVVKSEDGVTEFTITLPLERA